MDCQKHSEKSIGYQIRICGKLDPKWSGYFAGFLITHTNGETVLEGAVADQSALYGILAKIHDLGLTLIRVERRSIKEEVLNYGNELVLDRVATFVREMEKFDFSHDELLGIIKRYMVG